jgi:hypothetical protein
MLTLLLLRDREAVMGCRDEGTHLMIGCDANSQHTSWGSTNTNNRGEYLFNYIMAKV